MMYFTKRLDMNLSSHATFCSSDWRRRRWAGWQRRERRPRWRRRRRSTLGGWRRGRGSLSYRWGKGPRLGRCRPCNLTWTSECLSSLPTALTSGIWRSTSWRSSGSSSGDLRPELHYLPGWSGRPSSDEIKYIHIYIYIQGAPKKRGNKETRF